MSDFLKRLFLTSWLSTLFAVAALAQNYESLFKDAASKFDQEDYSGALAGYLKCTKGDHQVELSYYMAIKLLALVNGDYNGALDLQQEASERFPESSDIAIARQQLFLMKGDYVAAQEEIEGNIMHHYHHPEIVRDIERYLESTQNYTVAARMYGMYADRLPEDLEEHLLAGKLFMAHGVKNLQQAQDMTEEQMLLMIPTLQDIFQRSKIHLLRAHQLDPQHEGTLAAILTHLDYTKPLEDAAIHDQTRKSFQKKNDNLIRIKSTECKNAWSKAEQAKSARQYNQAIGLYQEVIRSSCDVESAYIAIYEIEYLYLKDVASAISTMEEALTLFPLNQEILADVTYAYLQQKRPEKAVSHLSVMIENFPDFEATHTSLYNYYDQTGRYTWSTIMVKKMLHFKKMYHGIPYVNGRINHAEAMRDTHDDIGYIPSKEELLELATTALYEAYILDKKNRKTILSLQSLAEDKNSPGEVIFWQKELDALD